MNDTVKIRSFRSGLTLAGQLQQRAVPRIGPWVLVGDDCALSEFSGLVDAIEAFVYEKITYERRIVDDPEWATLRRVNETREHLLEVLQEAFRD
jgi:hypothetical protein